ncbi:MAG: glycerol-3-phosphate acyltransferase [bacterium]
MIAELFLITGAYLLGSVSFAYLIAKWKKGIDIRETGSTNAGAMNVARAAGLWYGVLVAVLDVLKGVLTVVAGRMLGVSDYALILAGAAVIAGHNWPVYLGFKGGNGMATLMGVLLAVMPAETFMTFGMAFGFGLILIALELPAIEIGAVAGYIVMPAIASHFNQPVTMVIMPLLLGTLLVPSRVAFLQRGYAEILPAM